MNDTPVAPGRFSLQFLGANATVQKQLRIFGQDVQVRAEVVQLAAGYAHADAGEILAWLRSARTPPRKVFVTHGEADAADALRARMKHELGWPAHCPEYFEQVELA
jgi:metallo-beta-lactamase family protein